MPVTIRPIALWWRVVQGRRKGVTLAVWVENSCGQLCKFLMLASSVQCSHLGPGALCFTGLPQVPEITLTCRRRDDCHVIPLFTSSSDTFTSEIRSALIKEPLQHRATATIKWTSNSTHTNTRTHTDVYPGIMKKRKTIKFIYFITEK